MIDHLAFRHTIFVGDSFSIKKQMNIHLIVDLLILAFWTRKRGSWSVSSHAWALNFQIVLKHSRLVIRNDNVQEMGTIYNRFQIIKALIIWNEPFCASSILLSKSDELWCELNSTVPWSFRLSIEDLNSQNLWFYLHFHQFLTAKSFCWVVHLNQVFFF